MDLASISLQRNRVSECFVLEIEGQASFIRYRENQRVIELLHTEVPSEMEGKGVAAALVEKTFKYLEENSLKMKPLCSYVLSYLKLHPEWERLRAPGL